MFSNNHLYLSSWRKLLELMSSRGNPRKNYERDKGCIPWENVLMTSVYSCEECVKNDGHSLTFVFLILDLSLSWRH